MVAAAETPHKELRYSACFFVLCAISLNKVFRDTNTQHHFFSIVFEFHFCLSHFYISFLLPIKQLSLQSDYEGKRNECNSMNGIKLFFLHRENANSMKKWNLQEKNTLELFSMIHGPNLITDIQRSSVEMVRFTSNKMIITFVLRS